MDDYSSAMPTPYYSQPMASWYPMEDYSVDPAHTLENRPRPGDLASTQQDPSHTVDIYPSLLIDAERIPEYHPFPQDPPSFPPSTNGFTTSDPPTIERVSSDLQPIESDPEDMSSDSESEQEDHPLHADAARWISIPPTQFDREYPGGNPFVIEELNLHSEEDSESPSYVELDGASAFSRIFIIFWAVEEAISFPRYTCTGTVDVYRDVIWDVLVELLEDGKVWLWVDGDEEKCADLRLNKPSLAVEWSHKYVKGKLSSSSLRLRKPHLPSRTQFLLQLSEASFAMRIAVIVWAILTSLPVREARWARGRADWIRSGPYNAVERWHLVLEGLRMVDLLVDEGQRTWDLEAAFEDTLRCHGHSCYPSISGYIKTPLKRPLKHWLYFQSSLCSAPLGNDVSMILFIDLCNPMLPSICWQCAKLKELYISSNDGHYMPRPSLVVLNDLWRSRFDTVTLTAWLRIFMLGISHGLISDAMLTQIDDKIRTHFDFDKFDLEYQPWVNRLPPHLRHMVPRCSESEWREAEHTVRRENQHDSVPTSRWDATNIGLGVWIIAIHLLLLEDSGLTLELTPFRYRLVCEDELYQWDAVLLDKPMYPSHMAASVQAFCDLVCDATAAHTCCNFQWDDCTLELQQCYAAAYLLLHPESQDVPLLEPLQRPVPCSFCSQHELEDDNHPCPCMNCKRCQKLPEANPLVPTQITASDAVIPPAEEMDDIVPTLAVVQRNSSVESQMPSTSAQSRASTLPKDVILPKLKTHFAKLLAQYDIPIQYTNLGAPQLPWCTLPQLLRNRRLEIAGWPQGLPLPDAPEKHNAKGIMGLSAKDARRLYEALPGISFRPMDKACARPREEESEDDAGNRPTKKVKGKGKAPEQGEKKFRVSDVQMVIPGIRIGKFN